MDLFCIIFNVSADRILGIYMRIASPYSVRLFLYFLATVWDQGITQCYLPPTRLSITGMNYTCLCSPAASPHFGGYSFPVPLRVGGWVVCNVGVLWLNRYMAQNEIWMLAHLCSGHIMLHGDPAPPSLKGHSPQFLVHICCGQTFAHFSNSWTLVSCYVDAVTADILTFWLTIYVMMTPCGIRQAFIFSFCYFVFCLFSTHGAAFVQIWTAGLECAARG